MSIFQTLNTQYHFDHDYYENMDQCLNQQYDYGGDMQMQIDDERKFEFLSPPQYKKITHQEPQQLSYMQTFQELYTYSQLPPSIGSFA
jgi:hypothetical protein